MARPDDPFGYRPDRESRKDPFAPSAPTLTPKQESDSPFGEGADSRAWKNPFPGPPPGGGWRWREFLVGNRNLLGLVISGIAVAATVATVLAVSLPGGESETQEVAEAGDTVGGTGAGTGGEAPPTPPPTRPPATPTAEPTPAPTPTQPPSTPTPRPTPIPTSEPRGEEQRGCDYQSGRDPHQLVSFDQTADRLHSCGEETWQVFVCTTRQTDQVDRVAYVDSVLGEAAAWFDWASGGQYDIDFSAGDGTIRLSDFGIGHEACFASARSMGWGESRTGAVILIDEPEVDPGAHVGAAGVGTCGLDAAEADKQFDNTGRRVAIAVHSSGSRQGVAVHELGHAQCWPHSYSGLTDNEYDNPADVMSFAHNWPVGTIAANRYAAGWIHPNQVHVHRESARSYTLSSCCTAGFQMLALLPPNSSVPAGGHHQRWWSIEVRDPEDEWEQGLAEAGVGSELGVLLHWIDQPGGWYGTGLNRRQVQVGGQVESGGGRSLVIPRLAGPGAELCLKASSPSELVDCAAAHDWRIEVAASQVGGLTVTVAPGGN